MCFFQKSAHSLMNEKIYKTYIKIRLVLNIPAQEAKIPSSFGPYLGQYGIEVSKFCTEFNKASIGIEKGILLSLYIYIFSTGHFIFFIKAPVVQSLIEGVSLYRPKIGSFIYLNNIYKIALIINYFNFLHQVKDLFFFKTICKNVLGTCRAMKLKVIDRLKLKALLSTHIFRLNLRLNQNVLKIYKIFDFKTLIMDKFFQIFFQKKLYMQPNLLFFYLKEQFFNRIIFEKEIIFKYISFFKTCTFRLFNKFNKFYDIFFFEILRSFFFIYFFSLLLSFQGFFNLFLNKFSFYWLQNYISVSSFFNIIKKRLKLLIISFSLLKIYKFFVKLQYSFLPLRRRRLKFRLFLQKLRKIRFLKVFRVVSLFQKITKNIGFIFFYFKKLFILRFLKLNNFFKLNQIYINSFIFLKKDFNNFFLY